MRPVFRVESGDRFDDWEREPGRVAESDRFRFQSKDIFAHLMCKNSNKKVKKLRHFKSFEAYLLIFAFFYEK